MVLLSFFQNTLATLVTLNVFVRKVHLSLSRIMALIHSSRLFLSDVEEMFWGKESGVSVLFGLIVVPCFFSGSEGVRVGDVKWRVFCFCGGNSCFIAATFASSASRDDDVKGGCGSGLILRGMGDKWKSFVVDVGSEDRIVVVDWDHDGFVVDINGVEGFSWSPSSPVVCDVKVSLSDKGTEEVEMIVVGVHANENNPVVGAKGEDGRGGES